MGNTSAIPGISGSVLGSGGDSYSSSSASASAAAAAAERERIRQAEELRRQEELRRLQQAQDEARARSAQQAAQRDIRKQALRDAVVSFSKSVIAASGNPNGTRWQQSLGEGLVGGVEGYYGSIAHQKDEAARKKEEEQRLAEHNADRNFLDESRQHERGEWAEDDVADHTKAETAAQQSERLKKMRAAVLEENPQAALWSDKRIESEYERITGGAAEPKAKWQIRTGRDGKMWRVNPDTGEHELIVNDPKPPADPKAAATLTPYQQSQNAYRDQNRRYQSAVAEWKATLDEWREQPSVTRGPRPTAPRFENYAAGSSIGIRGSASAGATGAKAPPGRVADRVSPPEKTTRATAPEAAPAKPGDAEKLVSAAKGAVGGGQLGEGQRAAIKARIVQLRAQGISEQRIMAELRNSLTF